MQIVAAGGQNRYGLMCFFIIISHVFAPCTINVSPVVVFSVSCFRNNTAMQIDVHFYFSANKQPACGTKKGSDKCEASYSLCLYGKNGLSLTSCAYTPDVPICHAQ